MRSPAEGTGTAARGEGASTAAVSWQLEAAFPQRSTTNPDLLSAAPGPLSFYSGLVQAIRGETGDHHDEPKQGSVLASSPVLRAPSRPVVTVSRRALRQLRPRDGSSGEAWPRATAGSVRCLSSLRPPDGQLSSYSAVPLSQSLQLYQSLRDKTALAENRKAL